MNTRRLHWAEAALVGLVLACIVVWAGAAPAWGQAPAWASYPPLGVNGGVFCATMYTPAAGPLAGQTLLVIGGDFTLAGSVPVSKIAAWNGTTWSDMNGGMTVAISSGLGVDSLTVWDPDGAGVQPPLLIAGGRFTTAGGVAARNIAQWDGTAWSSVGSGTSQRHRRRRRRCRRPWRVPRHQRPCRGRLLRQGYTRSKHRPAHRPMERNGLVQYGQHHVQ